MKILFCFMGTLNPSCGGVERTMCNLIHELQDRGHECTVAGWYRNAPYAPFSGIQKILPTPPVRATEQRQQGFRQIMEEQQPDIIIHDGELLGACALFPGLTGRKRLLEALPGKTPVIIDMHHSDIRGRFRAPFLKRLYYGLTWRRNFYLRIAQADAFVVLSDSFKKDFYDFLPGIRREKITAIPNMNSFENGSIPSGKAKEVLFVGRLDNPVKGVDRLLKIWSTVCPQEPDWFLRIVGDGPDREYLAGLAEEFGCMNYSFEGASDHPEEYYRRAPILCMTSTFEGFGMVLIEGMQHGCVPMAFDSFTAVRDIMEPDRTGILVRPFDLEQYAARLLDLMRDGGKREAMAEACFRSSRKFSKSRITGLWEDLFTALAETRR